MFKIGCSYDHRTVGLAVMAALGLISLLSPTEIFAAPQLRYDTEYPSIRYSTRERTDRLAKLRARIQDGTTHLQFEETGGYLAAILEALAIPVSSQMLVFTGTSFQGNLVSPRRPRALYFNDDTYVAFVQGSEVLEISAIDPVMGGVFYSMSQDAASPPNIVDESGLCLGCHDSYGLSGGGAPRHLVGSMLPNRRGMAVTHEGWRLTDDRTSLRRRWGGWYVTGTHGSQVHMGNVMVRSAAEVPELDFAESGNKTDLGDMLNVAPYLTGHSDIVALMILEHQVHVQNLITRLNYDVRTALYKEREDARAGGPDRLSPAVRRVLEASGELLVKGLLLTDEATLQGRIKGTSGYADDFMALGLRDARGRSLRDLDLRERLFLYPLSYLIHSESFASMPDVAKEYVYRRLHSVLSGENGTDDFSHLSELDREAILEILYDTAPEFVAAGR